MDDTRTVTSFRGSPGLYQGLELNDVKQTPLPSLDFLTIDCYLLSPMIYGSFSKFVDYSLSGNNVLTHTFLMTFLPPLDPSRDFFPILHLFGSPNPYPKIYLPYHTCF